MTGLTQTRAQTDAGRRVSGFVALRFARMPFTITVAALIVALSLLTGVLAGPSIGLRRLVGTGFEPVALRGHWWSPLTALFFTNGFAALIVAIIAIVVLVGFAEHLLGTWRTVVAFAVTPIVGTVVGVALQFLVGSGGLWWAHTVRTSMTLDPLSAVAGTLMASSAFAGALMRRRIRILTLLVCILLLLYSGQSADLYRLIAVGAGWALGLAFRPPTRAIGWVRSSHHEVRVLLSAAVAAIAVGPALALFSGSHFGPLAPIGLLLNGGSTSVGSLLDDCSALNVSRSCVEDITLERINGVGPILLSILPLATLLLIAFGILRGRRFAVGLGVAMNGGFAILGAYYLGFLPRSGVPYLAPHADFHYWGLTLSLAVSVALPAVIAVVLIVLRRHFSVLASRRRVISYFVTVAASAVVLTAAYVGFGWLLRGNAFTRPISAGDLFVDAIERFIPVSFLHREIPNFLPTTFGGDLLYHGVGPVFWCVVFLAAIPALVGTPETVRSGDAQKARDLVTTGGGDTLAYMTTWLGNSYWFDTVSGAAVAYRVRGGIALTTGGPFGTRHPNQEIIAGFARFCDDNGWMPVFYSAEQSLVPIFHSIGWQTMVVAEEAVVALENWSTTGKKWQDVRTSMNRAERAGVRAEWVTYSALPLAISRQLTQISEQWVADKQLPEMGFTLGGLEELRDPNVRLMLAIDEHDVVQGITSWLPSYDNGDVVGWTLDFMRRKADSMNGVMEFLIARSAVRMREDGCEFMSLSGAPLAHTAVFADTTSSAQTAQNATDRFLTSLSGSLEPIYGFRSLLAFKKKFQPELRPLVMAFPDPVALPRVALALLRAYLPGLSVRQVARLVRGAP